MAVRRAPGRASHSGPKGPDGRTPAAARGLLGESHVAYRAVLLAAFLIVVGLIFRQIVTLLLAILMTIIIAIPLSSFATALQRRRIPRPLGALCGLLGVFVTLRGMSYIGHGLSHAIFGGAAVCAAIGVSFFVGAGLWGLASGLAVSRITKRRIIGSVPRRTTVRKNSQRF